MQYRIEKDIALPDAVAQRGRKPIYPITEMEVGDSFFVPVVNSRHYDKVRASIHSSASLRGAGKKFRCVTRNENGVSGVRCWRVE